MPTDDIRLLMLRRMLRIRFFEQRLSKFYDYSGYYAQANAATEAQSADDLLMCVSYDFTSSGMIGGAVPVPGEVGRRVIGVFETAEKSSKSGHTEPVLYE